MNFKMLIEVQIVEQKMTIFDAIVEKKIIIVDAIVEKKKTFNNIMCKAIKKERVIKNE